MFVWRSSSAAPTLIESYALGECFLENAFFAFLKLIFNPYFRNQKISLNNGDKFSLVGEEYTFTLRSETQQKTEADIEIKKRKILLQVMNTIINLYLFFLFYFVTLLDGFFHDVLFGNSFLEF